jgi:parallel beta-helix repeat protein
LYPQFTGTISNNLILRNASGQGLLLYSDGGNTVGHNTVIDTRQAFYLAGASGETIKNNIFNGPTTDTPADNQYDVDTGTTNFLGERKGLFWLTAASSLDAGGVSGVVADDFWGDTIGPDIHFGCFSYRANILEDAYREDWYYGWPYEHQAVEMPDLWDDGLPAGTPSIHYGNYVRPQ